MLVQMAKVHIIGTHEELERTVQLLHRAGVLQIEEKPASVDSLTLGEEAARQRDDIAQAVTKLDALQALVPGRPRPGDIAAPYQEQAARETHEVLADVRAALAGLDAPARSLARRHDELDGDLVTLPRYAKTMRQLAPLAADLTPLKNYETVALLVEHRFRAVIEMLQERLAAITNGEFELVSRDIDPDTTGAVLVFPREHSSAVQTLLGRENITQVRLPDELSHGSFKEALNTIEARLAAIPQERKAVRAELDALGERWHTRLAVWSVVLHDRLQELEVRSRFGATQYTFVVAGWMPSARVGQLREALAREVGAAVIVDEIPLTSRELEHAPVVFSNPRVAQPFEFLVQLMSLPRYGTIDPTPIMAIFLPVFFGMILGDIGYGVIVLLGALYLLRRAKPGGLKSLLIVMVYCSAWSILFGYLYGELFGTLGEEIGLHPLFNRAEAVVPLFAFSIALGVVQTALGYALGIYQAIKLRQRHELLDRIAKVIALIALFALAGVSAQALPAELFAPSLTLLLVGTVILMYTIGWIGILLAPIEILGTVGNILSYLRLAAIGLSSVYLAMVANKLAGIFGNVVIGVIVAALFHALNIALGVLSPTIQSLRLHYVEFFGKFFEGGGEGYTPFRRSGLY